MSITQLKYRLDLTGEVQANRVEYKKTIGVTSGRSFALPYGAFFAHNFVIIDSGKPQEPLKRGRDYELLYHYSRISKMAKGKEIVGVIKITNADVGTNLTCFANIVGAEFVNHYEFITRAIEDLDIDNREIQFWNVEGVPEVWEAAAHLQDIGDVFGFEYIISILSELVSVISSGTAPEIKAILDSLTAMETRLRNTMQAHINAEGNVHKATPGQIGTYTSSEIDDISNGIRRLIDELAQRVLGNENTNSEQAEAIESLGRMFSQHTQTLSGIRNDLNALAENSGDNNEQITQLKQQDTEHTQRLDAIQEDLGRNWEDQRILLTKINKNTSDITLLKQRADSTEGRVDQLEAAFSRLGVGRIIVSSTEPAGPQEDDVWIQV